MTIINNNYYTPLQPMLSLLSASRDTALS